MGTGKRVGRPAAVGLREDSPEPQLLSQQLLHLSRQHAARTDPCSRGQEALLHQPLRTPRLALSQQPQGLRHTLPHALPCRQPRTAHPDRQGRAARTAPHHRRLRGTLGRPHGTGQAAAPPDSLPHGGTLPRGVQRRCLRRRSQHHRHALRALDGCRCPAAGGPQSAPGRHHARLAKGYVVYEPSGHAAAQQDGNPRDPAGFQRLLPAAHRQLPPHADAVHRCGRCTEGARRLRRHPPAAKRRAMVELLFNIVGTHPAEHPHERAVATRRPLHL